MKKTIWPGTITGYLILIIFISLLPAIPCSAQSRPVNYKLEVELLPPTASLLGRETIVWTNLSQDYIPDMYFHLYWNAFKNELSTLAREARQERYFKRYRTKEEEWGWIKITSLTTADGQDLLTSAAFISPDEPANPHDQTVLRIILPEPRWSPGQFH